MVNVCMGSHVVDRFYSEENSLTGSSEGTVENLRPPNAIASGPPTT